MGVNLQNNKKNSNSFNFWFCIQFCNFRTIRTFSEPAGIKYWIVRKASVRTERTKIRVFLILILYISNIGVTSAHLALPLGSPVHIWMAS